METIKSVDSVYLSGEGTYNVRRLRVLQIYRTYFPETQGGLQEAIRQLSVGLRQAGVESDIFTLAKDPSPSFIAAREGGIHRCGSVIELASCDIGSPQTLRQFRSLAHHYDVLNFHYPWPFGDLLALTGAAGKPYVITYHSDIVRQRVAEWFYAPLRRLFFSSAEAVLATSPTYASTSRFLQRLPYPVKSISLGIDESIRPMVRDATLNALSARFPEPFFLFVGVLRYYKGLNFLIEAARHSGLQVVIAGNGPEFSNLKELAREMPNVHLLGFISDEEKFALMSLARAVVFPSHLRAEAFGVTLLEGALSGRPLISTEIGTGTSYVNLHRETGLVVPPADSSALAKAMQELATDNALADRFARAARQRYEDQFTARLMGQRYASLYEEILRVRRGKAAFCAPLPN